MAAPAALEGQWHVTGPTCAMEHHVGGNGEGNGGGGRRDCDVNLALTILRGDPKAATHTTYVVMSWLSNEKEVPGNVSTGMDWSMAWARNLELSLLPPAEGYGQDKKVDTHGSNDQMW